MPVNQFDMTGKVATVTGSSRGIGEPIAHTLTDHGARVAITSCNIGACEEVAAAISAKHPDAAFACASGLSSKESLQALVDATKARFGQVDALVCNAASNPHHGPIATITDEQFRRTLDNNILTQHWLIQMAVPEMRTRRAASIVIVSSIGGERRDGPDRRAARDRRRGGVPRIGRVELHDWADGGRRRRGGGMTGEVKRRIVRSPGPQGAKSVVPAIRNREAASTAGRASEEYSAYSMRGHRDISLAALRLGERTSCLTSMTRISKFAA